MILAYRPRAVRPCACAPRRRSSRLWGPPRLADPGPPPPRRPRVNPTAICRFRSNGFSGHCRGRRPSTSEDAAPGVPRRSARARRLTIEDILGPDYLKGPVPARAGMTHQEFLDMVTPKDYQGYARVHERRGDDRRCHVVCAEMGASESHPQVRDRKAGPRTRGGAEGSAGGAGRLEKARLKAGLPPR